MMKKKPGVRNDSQNESIMLLGGVRIISKIIEIIYYTNSKKKIRIGLSVNKLSEKLLFYIRFQKKIQIQLRYVP